MFLSRLWTLFLLALSQNVDDFMMGLAYGLQKTKFTVKTLILFVVGSALAMFIAMELGRALSGVLNETVGNYLSAFLLMGLGCWMIIKNWSPRTQPDQNTDFTMSDKGSLGFWQTVLLGAALGVDDVIEAIGLAMAKFPIVLTVIVFKLVEITAIYGGMQLGYLGWSKFKIPKVNLIPGIILILLGLDQLF